MPNTVTLRWLEILQGIRRSTELTEQSSFSAAAITVCFGNVSEMRPYPEPASDGIEHEFPRKVSNNKRIYGELKHAASSSERRNVILVTVIFSKGRRRAFVCHAKALPRVGKPDKTSLEYFGTK